MIEGNNSTSSPIEVVMNEKKLVVSERFYSIDEEEKVQDAIQNYVSYISSGP